MSDQVVNGVEIESKVIVQQRRRLVRLRVHRPQRRTLFAASNGLVTTRRTPEDLTIVEGTSVGGIDWRFGNILRQLGIGIAQVHGQLGDESRLQLREVQLVLGWHVDRRFVNNFRNLEHELMAGLGSQDLTATFLVENEEIGRFDRTHLSAISYDRVAESRNIVDGGYIPNEVIASLGFSILVPFLYFYYGLLV